MGIEDKAENTKDEWVGKAKQGYGDATDDEEVQAEGQMQEAKGSMKQAGEKLKDVFKK